MADKPVTIDIRDGELTYDFPKRRLSLAGKDTISWTCSGRPFTIQFVGISPLVMGEIRAFDHTSQVSVRVDAQQGTYAYACAVCDIAANEVYLDAACPAIIIQR